MFDVRAFVFDMLNVIGSTDVEPNYTGEVW